MRLLDTWRVGSQTLPSARHTIELLRGDLTRLSDKHSVDLLVVSAYPGDYLATENSLIGALDRVGVSVESLAAEPELDLRTEFSCWVSRLVEGRAFRRILCVESGWRGSPPENADDLFRALAPVSLADVQTHTVAMPVIGAGDQGWPVDQMLHSILAAAAAWFRRGMPVDVLKIVVYSEADEEVCRRVFATARRTGTERSGLLGRGLDETADPGHREPYDVFLSYSHHDAQAANTIIDAIHHSNPRARIFCDRPALQTGASWLMTIAESLDNSRRVLTLHTPEYWSSNFCKDEYGAAFMRQLDTGQSILFPILFRRVSIPYLFRGVLHEDCVQSDSRKLRAACEELGRSLL